jgi:hypothetical protein
VEPPDPLARVKRIARRDWPLAAALEAAIAVLGLALHRSIHWGDFPTWLLAITTLLALLAAAFAGVVAYDLFKVEIARDLKAAEERLQAAADRRQAAKDRQQAETERAEARRATEIEQAAQREASRRAQASKVTAWFAYYGRMTGEPAPTDVPLPLGSAEWGAVVRNAAEQQPVFDVRIHYFRVNGPRDGSPWTATEAYASTDIIGVIAPGQTRTQALPAQVRNQYEECNDRVYVVGIEFTDANGVRWYRNERAVLEER